MRVLVVDDEPAVRHLAEIALARRGHNVLTARGADEAAALLLDFPDPPQVVLLDVVLPGITGIAFGDILHKRFPQVRLIFMTGWSDRPDIAAAERRGPILSKPFVLADLVALVEKPTD